MAQPRVSNEIRFWAKTRRDPCGCLIWTGAVSCKYGRMLLSGTRSEKKAHHVAFFLAHGRWADYLLHSCDTPLCVEEKHLVEGDHDANTADKVAKGRQARGEGHGRSKLTADDVFDIRWARGLGAKLGDLADEYSVNQSCVQKIASHQTWSHV